MPGTSLAFGKDGSACELGDGTLLGMGGRLRAGGHRVGASAGSHHGEASALVGHSWSPQETLWRTRYGGNRCHPST